MGLTTPSAEPPEGSLLRLIGGYRITQALYTVTKLGVVDALARGPATAEELARRVGAQPDRLFRVLRALASLHLLEVDDAGRFALTDITRLLRHDPKGSMASVIEFAGEEPYRAWGELLRSVRTGETAFDHRYGVGHFEYLSSHPEPAAVFHQLMAWSVRVEGDPLAGYDLTGRRLLVDIGGGRGTLISSLLRSYPQLRAILFDLAPAVEGAPRWLAEEGVDARCQIQVGSALDSVPPGGDVYVMSRILHDWPDLQAERILANCHRAMGTDAVLLILDGVMPTVDPPASRAWLDLVMMVMTGGRERTELEWRQLLSRGGFRLGRVRSGPANQDLLVGHPV